MLLHAVGVHGMVLLTLPAVVLAAAGVPEARRRRLVTAMAACVVTGLAGLALQAFGQRPWDALPGFAVAGLAALALGYAGTLAVALVRARSA